MAQPVIMTETLLSTIRQHARLPRHSWYFIAGTTLSALNRPDEVPRVLKYALERGGDASVASPTLEEQMSIARRLRESLIKATAVCGLPKV